MNREKIYRLPPEVLFCRALYYFVVYVSHFWHQQQQLLRFANDVRAPLCALQAMFPIRGQYYHHFHPLPVHRNKSETTTTTRSMSKWAKHKLYKFNRSILLFWLHLSKSTAANDPLTFRIGSKEARHTVYWIRQLCAQAHVHTNTQ